MKTKEIDWKYKKIKGCSNQVPEDFRVSGTSQELVETVAKHKKIKEKLSEIENQRKLIENIRKSKENQRKSKKIDWKQKNEGNQRKPKEIDWKHQKTEGKLKEI